MPPTRALSHTRSRTSSTARCCSERSPRSGPTSRSSTTWTNCDGTAPPPHSRRSRRDSTQRLPRPGGPAGRLSSPILETGWTNRLLDSTASKRDRHECLFHSRARLWMFTAFLDERSSVAFPFPRRNSVSNDGFEKRAEGKLAVVAVCEQDHAHFPALKADHVILCAIAMSLFEEGRSEARMR